MERVFLPKPLPGDPEMPDEEAEEAAKRTEPVRPGAWQDSGALVDGAGGGEPAGLAWPFRCPGACGPAGSVGIIVLIPPPDKPMHSP